MADLREFVCIVCPRGCALRVFVRTAQGAGGGTAPEVEGVEGNACKRGEDYARSEVVDPRRTLTSTVRVEGFARRRLPVRSSGSLPLARLKDAARALDSVVADRPLRCGEVLVRDLLGLGIDIIACDDLGLAPSRSGIKRS